MTGSYRATFAAGHRIKQNNTDMEIKVVQTDKAPAAIGPNTQATAAGQMVFVSGQLGINPETGDLVGQDFSPQARQALENMRQILLAAGCRLTQVAAVDVFITDMGNFSGFNEIYDTFFSDHRPARAVVAVRDLPKGASVEIKCIAIRS
jgi:2-iminobutanoate/2-iminopropanoate deaminase